MPKLINRGDLRTAITAGLGNGLGLISGLPYGFYVPLAVLAASSGTYGSSLKLGRQRILGSVLGSVLVVVGSECLKGVPMPLGLALTLGLLRLLGGWLNLQVGYKVGGMIVVMGWLSHGSQLDSWIPLRLGWTAVGVLLALVSLRFFWPAPGLGQILDKYAQLLAELQTTFGFLADRIDPDNHSDLDHPSRASLPPSRLVELRNLLMAMRRQIPILKEELGINPERHPAMQLIRGFDNVASRLLTAVREMERLAPPLSDQELLARIHRAECDLLRSVVMRMGLWQQILSNHPPGLHLPTAPRHPFTLPETWLNLGAELNEPSLNNLELERLQRIATRLVLCRQAQQAMVETERQWTGLQP